jgi:hypothetical protein
VSEKIIRKHHEGFRPARSRWRVVPILLLFVVAMVVVALSRPIAAASSSSRRARTSTRDFHGALDRDRQAAERTAGCTCGGGRILGARFGAQVDEGVQLGLVQQVVSPHGAPPIRPRSRP